MHVVFCLKRSASFSLVNIRKPEKYNSDHFALPVRAISRSISVFMSFISDCLVSKMFNSTGIIISTSFPGHVSQIASAIVIYISVNILSDIEVSVHIRLGLLSSPKGGFLPVTACFLQEHPAWYLGS